MHQRVGVRELRRDLSEYLRRVERGESFAVTSRGRAVAVLGPSPGQRDALARLVRDRAAIAPRIGMHEAKTQLSRLVNLAESGEEVIIQRSGRPVARLVALPRRRPVAEPFGTLRGEIDLADDFDELPPELAEHFR